MVVMTTRQTLSTFIWTSSRTCRDLKYIKLKNLNDIKRFVFYLHVMHILLLCLSVGLGMHHLLYHYHYHNTVINIMW